ncbi:innexin inx2-like [Periplaneta americana]|uniref:innexin inx2-like n=1 Tax=Periplaneta americana TaxID=6978 RepID=UPI0037E87443
MSDLLGSVRALLKLQVICIDNNIFRLHYKVTVVMLVVFSLIVTSKQYFGDPIHCYEESGIHDAIIDSYCWIYSTFTVTKHFKSKVGRTASHPGVGTFWENKDNVKYTRYYQWVCFVLFFQALLFYAPRFLWKTWEGGRVKLLADDLGGPLVNENWSADRKKRILDYFKSSKIHTNNFYALRFAACEMLNLINVIGQIYFLDKFLGGEFTSYGPSVISFLEDTSPFDREDPMTKLFPKVTKCMFRKYGPSGTIQLHDAICILPLNVANEKIFVFLWFWFIVLAVITALALVYRAVVFLVPQVRSFFLLAQTRFVPRCKIQLIVQKMSSGDWFFLYQLGKNLNPIIFREVILDLPAQLEAEVEDEKSAVV